MERRSKITQMGNSYRRGSQDSTKEEAGFKFKVIPCRRKLRNHIRSVVPVYPLGRERRQKVKSDLWFCKGLSITPLKQTTSSGVCNSYMTRGRGQLERFCYFGHF